MCRNIRCLHNFAPPTTDDEVREAALQFVHLNRPADADVRSRIAASVADGISECLNKGNAR